MEISKEELEAIKIAVGRLNRMPMLSKGLLDCIDRLNELHERATAQINQK